MFLLDMLNNKLKKPSAEQALPGRQDPIETADRHFVLDHPIHEPFPENSETALFGLGCFWGAERIFWELPGVIVTAVGYASGVTPNPTYQEVCTGLTGHNEVVLVVFDPARTSYDELLRVFWESHDPTQGMRQGNDIGTQYRSGILCVLRYATPDSGGLVGNICRSAGACRTRFANHDGNPRRSAILLCGSLSPAISGEESKRLLRSRRDRRHLPGFTPERVILKRSGSRMRISIPVSGPGGRYRNLRGGNASPGCISVFDRLACQDRSGRRCRYFNLWCGKG